MLFTFSVDLSLDDEYSPLNFTSKFPRICELPLVSTAVQLMSYRTIYGQLQHWPTVPKDSPKFSP